MAASSQTLRIYLSISFMITIKIDPKMKNIIKVLLFFLILIGCVTPYQEVGSGGGYSDTQKYNLKAPSEQHLETSTGEKIKAVSRQQDILDQAGRLRSFLFLYCRAYESKDLDKFSAFFASDATENNRAFHEFLPRYRRNFERIVSFNYRIDLDSYTLDTDTGNIKVKGKYFIQYLLNDGTWKENNGIISMELIESGDSYLVKRLNYSYLSLE
jgi:hypothetical protein